MPRTTRYEEDFSPMKTKKNKASLFARLNIISGTYLFLSIPPSHQLSSLYFSSSLHVVNQMRVTSEASCPHPPAPFLASRPPFYRKKS